LRPKGRFDLDKEEASALAVGLRRRAEETRRLAARATDPEIRDQWLTLAAQYDKLASDYEAFPF
jgi:hypothetical protein